MDRKALIVTAISILFLISCVRTPKQDFYSGTRDFDLYRLPILEPVLVTSPSASSGYWFLDLPFGKVGGLKQINVDSFYVDKNSSVTLIGSSIGKDYIIRIDVKDSVQVILEENFTELRNHEFYEPQKSFEVFKQTGELPWRSEYSGGR